MLATTPAALCCQLSDGHSISTQQENCTLLYEFRIVFDNKLLVLPLSTETEGTESGLVWIEGNYLVVAEVIEQTSQLHRPLGAEGHLAASCIVDEAHLNFSWGKISVNSSCILQGYTTTHAIEVKLCFNMLRTKQKPNMLTINHTPFSLETKNSRKQNNYCDIKIRRCCMGREGVKSD